MNNFIKTVTIWISFTAINVLIAYNIANALGVICGIVGAYSGMALLWYVMFYVCMRILSPIIKQSSMMQNTEHTQNFLLGIIAVLTILNFFRYQ